MQSSLTHVDCKSLLSLDARLVATTSSPVRSAQHLGSARSRGHLSNLLLAHARSDTPNVESAAAVLTAEGANGAAASSNSGAAQGLGGSAPLAASRWPACGPSLAPPAPCRLPPNAALRRRMQLTARPPNRTPTGECPHQISRPLTTSASFCWR